jgi:1-hydroxycarotenoid 3,4-desaturase
VAQQRVVVIGAGIGGLVSAALLAARGLDVTVVEKQATPGGKVRQVPVGRTTVDGGPTVFTLRAIFDELFDACGDNLDARVSIRRAGILARHRWSGDEALDLHADPAASEAAIGDFAGADAARGYRAFAAEARRIYEILDRPFLQGSRVYPPGLMWRIGLHRIADLIAIRPYESLWSVLGQHFHDVRLQQLFARYATYCGSSPFRAPATLMLIAHVEAQGVWLIEGGMSALAQALADLAAEKGANFRYGESVTEIEAGNGRATVVVLGGGDRIAADAVIANADPAALASGALGQAGTNAVRPYPARDRSLSALTWLMQARGRGAPLARHNVFFSGNYPAEFADLADGRVPERPSVYVCALDRDEGTEPEGPERLQIIVNAPAVGDTHAFTPEEIDRCTRRMLERLKACGLELDVTAPPVVATPTDFETLFPSTGGALYGRASHGWAASFLRQSARTRIPGLYCAGGSTHPGAGVPMAALSGRLAAATLLKDLGSTARSRRAAMPGGMSTRSRTTDNSAHDHRLRRQRLLPLLSEERPRRSAEPQRDQRRALRPARQPLGDDRAFGCRRRAHARSARRRAERDALDRRRARDRSGRDRRAPAPPRPRADQAVSAGDQHRPLRARSRRPPRLARDRPARAGGGRDGQAGPEMERQRLLGHEPWQRVAGSRLRRLAMVARASRPRGGGDLRGPAPGPLRLRRCAPLRCRRYSAREELPPAASLPRTLWWMPRRTRSDDGRARVRKTWEDAPFYTRSTIAARLFGEDVAAVHESLCLNRFASPIVQRMLPYRMPRRVS